MGENDYNPIGEKMAKEIYASGESKIEISFDNGTTYFELKNTTAVNFSMDNNKEEFVPFNGGGWKKAYITSKGLGISVEKKYKPAEDADKKLMELALSKTAYEHNYASIKFTFPMIAEKATTAATFEAEVAISISDLVSQGSEDVANLKFEGTVNGKPTYTEEVVAP